MNTSTQRSGRWGHSGLRLLLAGAALGPMAVAGEAQSPPAPATMPTSVAYSPDNDPVFAQPYIDVDEWRDAPVRHRYVHGGFRGTETRFSFYLPPKERYCGRFFQHITPAPDSENLAQRPASSEDDKIGFAIASGGYFVETNGGGAASGSVGSKDSTIGAYRANAAAAAFSRQVAIKMYGGKRPFGYAYGGSGGAFRTVGSIENTRGVWDGAVPYVLGSSMAIPNSFTVRMHAMRILKDKFPGIVDAVDVGGSGDPYAGLNAEETAALHEVTGMGFPPQSWFGWRTMGIHGFAALYGGVVMADRGYFTDFWTKPGYYGFDHPESFVGARLQHASTVAAAITGAEAKRLGLETGVVNGTAQGNVDDSFASAAQRGQAAQVVAFRLAEAPPAVDFLGGDLIVSSGAAKGARLTLSRLKGDVVVLGLGDPAVAAKIAPGDAVQVDNSNFLAAQTYHRHQVPGKEFKVWDQFRNADGTPLYPQRPMLLGPLFTKATAGAVPEGRFDGKMILVESLWDREAFPWSADWYRARVAGHSGGDGSDRFRLWYTDRALHGDTTTQEDPSQTVSYIGVLHQALRDVSRWVETGTPPPPSTSYRVVDGQVILPAGAAERRGVQPVVELNVDGSKRAAIASGRPVTLTATITVPPGAGSIVAAEWRLGDDGQPIAARITRKARRITLNLRHAYVRPGTYFPTLSATSQRDGDATTPFARINNLARVRVVVR